MTNASAEKIDLVEKSQKKIEDETFEIEFILKDIGGSFGRFQKLSYCLYSIPMFIIGIHTLAFIFSASNLEYRCNISECDDVQQPEFAVDWMENVIPFKNSKPMKCHRYESIAPSINTISQQYCEKDFFNRSNIVRCDKDGLVYKTDEVLIANAFNLTCEGNEKWLSMVGMFSQAARLFALPLMANLSDRFGANAVVIYGTIVACIFGFLESYATNYTMFVVCEFMTVAATCTLFPTSMVLGMEWAEVNHRSVVSAFISIFNALGGVVCGLFAAYTRDYRLMLRLNYALSLVLISLLFFGSESFRWLLANGKRKRIEKLLTRAVKMNGRELSAYTKDIINRRCEQAKNLLQKKDSEQTKDDDNSLKALFTCVPLVLCFSMSVFVWLGTAFVTYGIHVVSVSIGGDKYTSFILVVLGGLPSPFLMIYMMKYIGRRTCISIGLIVTSACILVGRLVPPEYEILSLTLFFASKCFSMLAFLVLYIHTSEIWPTSLRHTMMGLSSACGRLGGILAPLTPLLSHISELLPFFTFAFMAFLAGIVVLFLPETFNKNLPDTLEDAKNLGNSKSKQNSES